MIMERPNMEDYVSTRRVLAHVDKYKLADAIVGGIDDDGYLVILTNTGASKVSPCDE